MFRLCAVGQTYFLNGDAQAIGENCYSLTQAFMWESGTVWYADQINLDEPFSLEFYMNFGNLDATGADGMVFVLQTNGTSAIGVGGDGIGFSGFTPSFGIEFDTWDNTQQSNNGDLAADHVAFLKNGNVNHNLPNNLAGPVPASGMSANIEDGQDHVIQITWDPQTQIVELFVDCMLRLSDQNDLINSIFGGSNLVYWGFTGATGGSFNVQTVCLSEFFINAEDEFLICNGDQIQIATSGNPQGTFDWSPATSLSDANSQSPFAWPNVTTEYCCIYTDLCGNQTEECILINVENAPVIDASNNAEFCEGSSYVIPATSNDPNAVYSWTTADGNFITGDNTLSPVVDATGNYVLTASTQLGECSSTDSLTLTEIPLPVIAPETPVYLCPDSSVTLDAGAGWDEILWSGNLTSQIIQVDTPGSYTLTVTENNCQNSASIAVSEVNLPVLNLGPDQLICEGENVVFNAGTTVDWSTGATAITITVNQSGTYTCLYQEEACSVSDAIQLEVQVAPVIALSDDVELCGGESTVVTSNLVGLWNTGETSNSIVVSEEGNYEITVTEGVCTSSAYTTVEVLSPPALDLGPDITYCTGETITISALDIANDFYLWSTGDTDPLIKTSQPGIFWVQAGNDCGSLTDSISIYFEECSFGIYIPNAFTPDNDGVNDYWKIESFNLTNSKVTIFDRWGSPVFETRDLDVPWTGDVSGGDYFAADGVYVYLLEFWTTTGEAAYRRGHITLIR